MAGSRIRSVQAGRTGFTLLELMLAVSVLVVGIALASHSILTSMKLGRSNHQAAIATEAVRRQVEVLRGEVLAQVFARYNTVTGDDPGGTAPGAHFVVAGLDPVPEDADGCAGEIVFPVAAGAGGMLREDVGDAALGMPRDLDLDGVVDAANHAANYRILPVLVRVRWRGPGGSQQTDVRTILGGL